MSYCEKCGQYIDDNSRFCQNCGAENPGYNAAPAYQAPVYQAPAVEEPKSGLNVMAIVAIALAGSGIVGLIFAIIALKNAKSGNFRTSLKPLAVAALIISIVMLVFWTVYIIVLGVGSCALANSGYNFDFDF
ncbi:MAG: zinc-ribbon domain-containing protein [Clostridia bacterium]|nr:zinc-ribbon domain-containing protein [Clostridia bacterium]